MTDMENEKEWRRLMYQEIKELRKDLQGFKLRMVGSVVLLTAAFQFVGTMVSKFIK